MKVVEVEVVELVVEKEEIVVTLIASYPDIHTSYPAYSYLHTPTYLPNMHIEYKYPRSPDIPPLVPRIFIPSYPGYLSLRTPDIHPFVSRIFIPSYPGYLSPRTRIFISTRTPDINTIVPWLYIRTGCEI